MRVEMEYDAKYKLPADAKAVIVTPTLVADRFVQLTPAYDGSGAAMADGADIPLPGDRRAGRARPDLRQPARPLRGARPQRRQQGRHPRPPARGVGEGARRARASSATRCSATSPPPAETFGEGSEDLFATVTELARVHRGAGPERPPGPGLHPGPGRHVVGAGQRAGRAGARPDLRRPRGRHREDVRRGQPRGAGHRHREADPGRQDDQLRAGEPRHRAAGRAAGARQPGRRVQQRDRLDRLADRRQRHLRRRRRPALLDRPAVRHAAGQQGPRLRALRAAPRAGRGPGLRRRQTRPAAAPSSTLLRHRPGVPDRPASSTPPTERATFDDLVGGGS